MNSNPHLSPLQFLLKNSRVSAEANELALANTATFATTTSSSIVVATGSKTDVVLLVQYCTAQKARLHVISRGKNWGFGSKVPPGNVDVLLDLSPMNQISSYDPLFGNLHCAAGVSFRQVQEFLQAQGDQHFFNAIGGDPDSSVVGNALERGDGCGPYCERAEYICALEVLLADGSLLNIGMGDPLDSKVHHLCKINLGPDFTGLFLQSNYGIVLGMTFWLCRKPEAFTSFRVAIPRQESLATVLDHLRELYERRILHDPITFWNDYKQLVNAIPYPWSLQPNPPLQRDTVKAISNSYAAWIAFGGIYTDHSSLARLTLKVLFQKLKGLIAPQGFWSVMSPAKIKVLSCLRPVLGRTKWNLEQIFRALRHNPLLGQVADHNTRSMFWRKKRSVPFGFDPHQEACGLLWNAFILPLQGKIVVEVFEQIEQITFKAGFEPIISFVVVNNRYIRVFFQLIYDREVLGEDQRALVCHQAIFGFLQEAGYSHSRLSIAHPQTLYHTALHQKIKNALDPNNIFVKGKY